MAKKQGSTFKEKRTHWYEKRKQSWRDREKKHRQDELERFKSNPEIMQARQEMFDEFMADHPELANLEREELHKKMQRHNEEEMKISRQKLRNHIETFSDGVIAVIITIMLLEIPMPTGPNGYTGFIEAVGIFLVSFIVTANFWFNHHKNFAVTEELTERMIVVEFIYMGMLSLIPLLTKWIMLKPNWFASLNYGLVLLAILILQECISYGITKHEFRNKPKSFNFWRRVWLSRLSFTILVNIAIMLIAIVRPDIGHWLFVIVPIFNFFFRGIGEGTEDFTLDVEEGKVNGKPRF
ncbi:TMEM175 family protein [Lactococcus nasutitermitis]|uniref:TMEM175 family protein n=1 Tax=Lactococcus nasutitermitis TaxID=1652957 RepID=A0ABV9JCL0_9LACT|nr:TMEM175 family protein [Lactococcus nasutitermitis]